MSDEHDTVWPPLGIASPSAHPYAAGRFGCRVCGSSMHCPHCGDQCGSNQGHLIRDADGFFLSCQDADRRERWHASWLKGTATS